MSQTQELSEIAIYVNGLERYVARDISVEQLLQTLNVRRAGMAIAINDMIVVRSKFENQYFQNGDRVEILHAVAGG